MTHPRMLRMCWQPAAPVHDGRLARLRMRSLSEFNALETAQPFSTEEEALVNMLQESGDALQTQERHTIESVLEMALNNRKKLHSADELLEQQRQTLAHADEKRKHELALHVQLVSDLLNLNEDLSVSAIFKAYERQMYFNWIELPSAEGMAQATDKEKRRHRWRQHVDNSLGSLLSPASLLSVYLSERGLQNHDAARVAAELCDVEHAETGSENYTYVDEDAQLVLVVHESLSTEQETLLLIVAGIVHHVSRVCHNSQM